MGGIVARPRSWDTATVRTIAVLAFLICLYRATTQDLTIDEASAYQGITSINLPVFWHSASANHLLNTLLQRVAVGSLDATPLTLRLPALAGAALYLACAAELCLQGVARPWNRLLAAFLLALNPFVLEYLVPARGYALGIGFEAAMLLLVLRSLRTSSFQRHMAAASVCGGLSIVSNYTFLTSVAAVLAVSAVQRWATVERRTRGGLVLAGVWALAPMIAVVGVVAGDNLAHMPKHEVSIGWASGTFGDMVSGVSALTFLSANPYVAPPHLIGLLDAIGRLGPWIVAACVALPAGALPLARLLARHRPPEGRAPLDAFSTLAAVCGSALALALLAHVAAWLLIGVGLPRTRTALHFVPLATVALLGLVFRAEARRTTRPAYVGSFALLSLIALSFAGSLRLTFFREWLFDADICSVIEKADDYALRHGLHHVEATWESQAAGNFYRTYLRTTLDPFVADELRPGHDVYIVPRRIGIGFINGNGLSVIGFWPLSETFLAVRLAAGERPPEVSQEPGWTRTPRGCSIHGPPSLESPNYPVAGWATGPL